MDLMGISPRTDLSAAKGQLLLKALTGIAEMPEAELPHGFD